MKTIIIAFFIMVISVPAIGQSCEFCGEWVYEDFDHTGRVTTDCEGTAKEFYKGSLVKLYIKEFSKTYRIDNYPTHIDNPEIQIQPAEYLEYDDNPNTAEISIKKDGQIIETFYFAAPDIFYNWRDGCRFYFKPKQMESKKIYHLSNMQ
jgi:hypothetical protein